MKIWIASASALLMACACSASKEATAALEAMNLETGKSSPMIQYAGKSGNGDTVTLNDVTIGGGTGDGLKAKSLVLGGLDITGAGKPVLTAMTLKGVTSEAPLPKGLNFIIDSIGIEGLNPVTGEFIASAFSDNGAAEPPPFGQWGFSKVSLNGMKFNGDFSSLDAKTGKFNVGLGELSVSNLKDTVFAAAKMAGFKGDFDVPPEVAGGLPIAGKFDFGEMDIKNIRGGVFADAIGAVFETALTDPSKMSAVEGDIMKNMSSPLEGGFDEFTWTGMSAEASGVKLAVSPTSAKITRNAEGVAVGQTAPRTTLTLTADASGGALGEAGTMLLSMVGYPSNTVQFYGESSATFDPASDTTRYTNYNFGLTDGFDVKATAGVQGLTKFIGAIMASMTSFGESIAGTDPFGTGTPDAPTTPDAPATPAPAPAVEPDLSGLQELQVVDLDLTITDKTLVNLLFGASGMFGAGDPATLRNDIVNMVKGLGPDLAEAGIDRSVGDELLNAVSQFLERPGSLNIRMKPTEPVRLVAGPVKIDKQSLGFSATFTPGPAAPAAPKPN